MSINKMKAESKFVYKCRRCGGIENNPVTNGANAFEILTSIVLGTLMPSKFKNQPMTPQILGIHNCGDGGAGVSDLIGITNSGIFSAREIESGAIQGGYND